MTMRLMMFVLFASAAISFTSRSGAAEPLPTLIVAGQSNAFRLGSLGNSNQGRAAGATIYYYANPHCTKPESLDATVKIFSATNPIKGSGAGIGWQLAGEFPNGIAIIRYAICGSNLHTQWMPTKPEGYYRKFFEPFVQQGLKKIEKASGRKPKVMGMLWHQGESNSSSPKTVEAFGRLMPAVISNFQKTHGSVPCILGEIREFPNQPRRAEINRRMHKIASDMPKVAAVKLQDVGWQTPTNVHFSRDGAHEAGKRLVEAWKSEHDAAK